MPNAAGCKVGGRGNYYIAVFKINVRHVFFYAVGAHKRRKLILCYRVLCKKIFLYFFNALFAVASAAQRAVNTYLGKPRLRVQYFVIFFGKLWFIQNLGKVGFCIIGTPASNVCVGN